jgi:hypothetical protein
VFALVTTRDLVVIRGVGCQPAPPVARQSRSRPACGLGRAGDHHDRTRRSCSSAREMLPGSTRRRGPRSREPMTNRSSSCSRAAAASAAGTCPSTTGKNATWSSSPATAVSPQTAVGIEKATSSPTAVATNQRRYAEDLISDVPGAVGGGGSRRPSLARDPEDSRGGESAPRRTCTGSASGLAGVLASVPGRRRVVPTTDASLTAAGQRCGGYRLARGC